MYVLQINEFSKHGLAEPELVDMDGDFRVNFYRKINSGTNVGVKLNSTQKILQMLIGAPLLTAEKISQVLNLQKRTIERNIKVLKDKRVLKRTGSDKDGIWIVDERCLESWIGGSIYE